ncbi:hypothetical protein [Nocardioides sp.]|uniref:hypothetical protein n=1 Tax=Nocardioides sp. TaxID=35761 RepID=UPI002723A279|nr:hypothetical protein [Nocardioides sp.]MDO9457327.1 hypothetical protein [Nocardioides sp.]
MTDPRLTLAPLVGEWSVAIVMPGDERPDPLPDVGARTTWEWLGDSGLLLQRWSIPIEGPPNGLAVIGWDEERGTFLQHYFDDRTVVRVYELRLEDGELTLERTRADFSPLDFSQRYVGTVGEGRIDGAWFMAEDHRTWDKDFDLVYTRLPTT